MKELKPGDKIKVYSADFNKSYSEFTAEVAEIIGYQVKYKHPMTGMLHYAHRKQVRLITKKKVKPITRGDLMLAVQKTVAKDVDVFRWSTFIEELEKIVGRKIK